MEESHATGAPRKQISRGNGTAPATTPRGDASRPVHSLRGITDIYSTMASLTPTQHSVLRALASSATPCRVGDVGNKIGLHNNTVRETLAVLCDMGLANRHREDAEGRGRPHWLYEATVTTDPDAVMQEFADFSHAVAEHVAGKAPDPEATAVELGRVWGRQMLKQAPIPDHSTLTDAQADRAATRDLAIHSAKTRMFLSKLGFEARPDDDPSIIHLFRCPLQVKPAEALASAAPAQPLICSIHQGMTEYVISTLSRGRLTTRVCPFAGTDHCDVVLTRVPHPDQV
jgi:predicted ArsR family transcriptional regulator